MPLSSDKVMWSIIYAVAGLATLGVTLCLFYFLLTSGFGVIANQAIIFITIIGIISLPAVMYGLYGAIRIKCFGETKDIRLRKISKLMPQNPRLYFWLIMPLLLPVFTYLYSMMLTFLVWIFSLPFGKSADKYSEFIDWAALSVGFVFAVLTIIALWQRIRRQSFLKSRDSGMYA